MWISLALLFQGDCLSPKHLYSNYFRLFLTKDRVLEIKGLQSHECKSHQQRILRKLHWTAQMVPESRSVCEWSIMKLVELKPPRLSITHWALLSHLPVYLSWHLCLPVNLTLSPLPLGPQILMRCHRTMPLYLQLLWIFPLNCGCVSQLSQGPFTSSPGSRVPLKLDNAGSPVSICCLTESCLSQVNAVFFFLSFISSYSHCYFKIIFFPLSKSPGLVTIPSLLLVTISYQLLRVSSVMNLAPECLLFHHYSDPYTLHLQ